MKKITIKKFVEEYNNRATDSLKGQYVEENLVITPYVPFLIKDAYIDGLLKCVMFDKESGNIKINSSAEYLLTIRFFIEQYTNLTVETEGFFEEYDELKKSGLFNVLLIGNEKKEILPMIPYEEITEFKYLLTVKKNDVMTNKYELHSFINEQIDRLKTLAKVVFTPLVNVIKKKVEEIPKEDLDKVVEFAKKGNFKEV